MTQTKYDESARRGCVEDIVRGHRHDKLVPCDAPNLPSYVMRIPGHVLLRVQPKDEIVSVGGDAHSLQDIPAAFDLTIDLYSIQSTVGPAIRNMSVQRFGPVVP